MEPLWSARRTPADEQVVACAAIYKQYDNFERPDRPVRSSCASSGVERSLWLEQLSAPRKVAPVRAPCRGPAGGAGLAESHAKAGCETSESNVA
jgi:hypothetical protein